MNYSEIDIDELIDGGAREQAFDEKFYETGISRKRIDKKFIYYYITDAKPVTKKDQERIDKLGIPPNWEELWVSSDPNSAIQATGIDAKDRKQYRYHERHIQKAEQEKFLRMYEFVKDMPKLESAMKRHEKLDPYNFKKVIATMLIIVRDLHMRVGKEVYARENKSYGVSSLRKKHMKLEKGAIKFNFKGKSKKRLSYTYCKPDVYNHLKLLLSLSGDRLFQYIDPEDDKIKHVSDMDLNRYIQKYMGPDYTVKDFRTYAANFYFIKALLRATKQRSPKNEAVIKKNILNALKSTSFFLKHSRSISKKSYVLNFAIELYRKDSKYFINKQDESAEDVLLDVLKLYRKKILKI